MSNPDPAVPDPAPAEEASQPEELQEEARRSEETAPADAELEVSDPAAAEPEVEVVQSEVEVELRRSVRWTRLLIVGAVIGVVVAVLASLSFPVEEGADYTMRQIAGFMAIIGGAIGVGIGGLLALILNQVAKRKHGRGVAIQTDVR